MNDFFYNSLVDEIILLEGNLSAPYISEHKHKFKPGSLVLA